MTAKMNIKWGAFEFSCEATEEFIRTDMPVLLEDAINLLKNADPSAPPAAAVTPGAPPSDGKVGNLSINSVAAKIGKSNGKELLLSAAVQLSLVQGKTQITYDEVMSLAKSSQYYNKAWGTNMASFMKSLVSGQVLTENADKLYTLNDQAKVDAKTKLGVEG